MTAPRGEPSEKGGDREEPLVDGIDGQPEQLEREGAEERATLSRAGEEGCRVLLFAQANANVTESVDHTLAARQHDASLDPGLKSQPSYHIGGKQRVGRAGVDEKVELYGALSMFGMGQDRRDRECAHA